MADEIKGPPPYVVRFVTHGGIYRSGDVAGFTTREKAALFVRDGYALPMNFDMAGYSRFGQEAAAEKQAERKSLSMMRKAELQAYAEDLGLEIGPRGTIAQLREMISAQLEYLAEQAAAREPKE